MSGSEVLGCVDLIATALQQATDLTFQLTNRYRKGRGERNYHQTLLLHEALFKAAEQIRSRYSVGFAQFGTSFQVGDGQ